MRIEIFKSINSLLNLPRLIKRLIALSLDLFCCLFSVWFSYYLRLGDLIPLSERGLDALTISIIISLPIFLIFGLYKNIFRYSGLYSLLQVSKAIALYGILFVTLISVIGVNGIPRTIGLIQPLLLLFLIISWRILLRYLVINLNNKISTKEDYIKALVYGSGVAGRQLVKAMQESKEIAIKGFLDDDKKKEGFVIDGKRIYSPKNLNNLIAKKNISLILLAIPSIPKKRRSEIIKSLLQYKIAVRTIPNISDLASGKSLITEFLELNINDLLGRFEVEPFQNLMKKNNFEKTILVTGAGGSIGSELCRQIINQKPKKIILIETSEYALYSIHQELNQVKQIETELIPLIGSVQDIPRMREIISIFKPFIIYHAAAYKHVPIVEHNLIEGLKNNVIGTFELANLALEKNVSNFVFISTDKAVRPTNIMGASKRLAELTLQALNNKNLVFKENAKTKFSIVRFGNVLESSGSVIPKFREQIKNGGPITITHPDMERFLMTISEAVQLVLQASVITKGGETFILNMGKPVKILEIAKKMIISSGLKIKDKNNKSGDIEIKEIGIRKGEKLKEELFVNGVIQETIHPLINKAKENLEIPKDIVLKIEEILLLIKDDNEGDALELFYNLLHDYKYQKINSDY